MTKTLTERVSLMVDRDTKRELGEQAHAQQRTEAAVARIAIREYLAGQRSKTTKAA